MPWRDAVVSSSSETTPFADDELKACWLSFLGQHAFALGSGSTLPARNVGVGPALEDFTFKVNLVAVVRVRADDESVARKVVPTVLRAPGTVEIRLANENNAAVGNHATITDVDFSIGSVKPFEKSG